ncbi:PepSY domain-containing protein [Roseateles cellulosilyticus]|uniref:PepSY domain-containing protein n=1 Tax=Pelomonas cellulosilytica TaxID=2906762 RepID=A0ABS8Y146_9BURK|nr:PepSY domain-containing protein [Pelomonas sp. P8]MCE4557720.1 PepSY domain-containing protein [Pelomonas sp. P8]
MKATIRTAVLPCVLALCLGAGVLSPANADDRRDHDRARAAVKAGEVLPLQEVLEKVQRSHPGEVLDVELERQDGRWVYELKLLQSGGRLLRLDVDAKTAAVLRSRQRPAPETNASAASAPARQP